MACGRMALLAVLFGLSFSGWAHADKLVVFQNGRTLRVQSVRDEGPWLYLTLGKKSEMGVLSRLIVAVNEIDGIKDGQSASVPNVQSPAGGSGGGQAAGARATATPRGRTAAANVPAGGQAEAASRARSDALARAANRASTGRVGRVPPSGKVQEQPVADSSADLGSSSSSGWRSLLESSSRGRSSSSDSGTDRQTEEKPKR